MRKNELFRKSICLALTITAMGFTTGCSVKFSTSDLENVKNIAAEIATTAEDTVFSDMEQIEEEFDAIAEANNITFEEVTLVRVVDGDTLVVSIHGEEKKVRLIGVNTPESVAPDSYRTKNSKEGVAASEYVKDLLKNTTTLYLQKDTSDTDRYDRLLRYVWLEVPEDAFNVNEVATKMLNGLLLMDNVAEVATYEPDTMYQETFQYIADTMTLD